MTDQHPLPSLKERDIFYEALEKRSPEECDAYLNLVCGDDQNLRASVESLLKQHLENQHKKPTASPFSFWQSADQEVVESIDRYKLLEIIGEGGFGVVYLAEQETPIYRQVAIKIIQLGKETKQIISRFEAERQILAKLEHSKIARFYDAGTTNLGRPYFVMELIRGQKITEYSDRHRLSIPLRLELFGKVCEAIQHAHLNGVI